MTQLSATSPQFEKGGIKVGNDRGNKKSIKLYYEKTGEGPIKLFLITGLGIPASGWDPVVGSNRKMAIGMCCQFFA
jgi:hypothetical protein